MKRTVTLRPGARGTKQLHAQFGNELMYVRYRYDPGIQKRYKTIELIIDEQYWLPREIRDMPVWVQLAFHERDLRLRIVRSGGRWDPAHQRWELRFEDAERLGLTERIAQRDEVGA
ncbi:MAG: hypothetical protein R2834_05485 [Rhodothermales bacterium]